MTGLLYVKAWHLNAIRLQCKLSVNKKITQQKHKRKIFFSENIILCSTKGLLCEVIQKCEEMNLPQVFEINLGTMLKPVIIDANQGLHSQKYLSMIPYDLGFHHINCKKPHKPFKPSH